MPASPVSALKNCISFLFFFFHFAFLFLGLCFLSLLYFVLFCVFFFLYMSLSSFDTLSRDCQRPLCSFEVYPRGY